MLPTTYDRKAIYRERQADGSSELARQIHDVLLSLLRFHAPTTAILNPRDEEEEASDTQGNAAIGEAPSQTVPIVYPQLLVAGDVSPAQDLSSFVHKSPNVLVATPGRLLELLSSPHVHCPQTTFEVLVLDEADRLLDMGFKDDLQKILGRLPKQRRTGLFSASVSEAVDQLVRVGLRNPVKIAVKVRGLDGHEDKRTPARYALQSLSPVAWLIVSSLQMCYSVQPASHKIPAIGKLLATIHPRSQKTIIYLSTCAAVEYFQHLLPQLLPKIDGQPLLLVPLHGKQQQKARQKNFARFSNATIPSVLLTTDVAARGLDIPQVDLVLQLDPPNDPKVFLHRCGRAGRAGRKGLSIVLLQPGREEDFLPFLEVRKTPLSPYGSSEIATSDDDAQAFTARMRSMVRADRSLHDKGQRGFVSWAQAYSKHQCSSVFRLVDQDWEDVGNAWGLLKLPKMPELKSFAGDKSLSVNVDWTKYAYADQAKEGARLRKDDSLPAAVEIGEQSQPSRTPAVKDSKRSWSQKADRQELREVRRAKRSKRREHERWEQMTLEERSQHQDLNALIQKVKGKIIREGNHEEFAGFGD